MKLFVVVRVGVYDQGIVGIYNAVDKARAAATKAKAREEDDYHRFEIREYKLNKTEKI